MTYLLLATAAFLVTHFLPSTPLRPKLVAAIGEWPYRGLYSAVAFVTLGWMIWAYSAAPREPLWAGLRRVPEIVMPVALVLLACGFCAIRPSSAPIGSLRATSPHAAMCARCCSSAHSSSSPRWGRY